MKSLKISLVLIFLSALNFSLAQNWSISHVDKIGDYSVELRIDARGDDIHIIAKGSFNKLSYFFSGNNGKTWTKTDMGTITHRTFEVGEISSLIDQNGVYHIAYFSQYNDIIHATKQSNSGWSRDTMLVNNRTYDDSWHRIFLEIDSKNKLHAFFKDHQVLQYFYYDDSIWTKRDVNFSHSSVYQEFTFDLDNFNTAHVVCSNYDGQLLHYSSNDLGLSWNFELIGNMNAERQIAMKTDSKGNPHIVYAQEEDLFRGKTELEIYTYLRKRSDGTWEKIVLDKQNRSIEQANDFRSLYHRFPAIDIDKKDGAHIAYFPGENSDFDYPIGDTIVYAFVAANKSQPIYKGVPCKKEFYPGVCIRVMNNNIYYGYIGSSDGVTDQMGIELAMKPFILEDEDTLQREDEIQAEVFIENQSFILDLWDSGEEDGDVLTILVNGVVFKEGFKLLNEHQQIPIELEGGKTYVLSVVAVSEGLYPPCTAVVVIKDGTNENLVTITSDTEKNGAIRLVIK
ncbi:MAG: hypothetical protein IPO32_12005 [Crocinitomicaceae bacterium]|nr:hypothetical protein [Crocinitomicaceae bacterium]